MFFKPPPIVTCTFFFKKKGIFHFDKYLSIMVFQLKSYGTEPEQEPNEVSLYFLVCYY